MPKPKRSGAFSFSSTPMSTTRSISLSITERFSRNSGIPWTSIPPGADHGNFLALRPILSADPQHRKVPRCFVSGLGFDLQQLGLRVGGERFDTKLLGDESFQSANAHRSVDFAAPAGILARSRAHPAANRSERIG